MTDSKITVVLVHDAWAKCASWTEIILPWQNQGLGVVCAPNASASNAKVDGILKLAGTIVVKRGEITDDEFQSARKAGLKPLFQKGWLEHEEGEDRREKWIALTLVGRQQVERARPAWAKAQARMREPLPGGMWDLLIESLPNISELSERA